MNSRVAIFVIVICSATAVQSQQPPASACPGVEALKLQEQAAKQVSEYASAVADSVRRSWNTENDSTSQNQWSAFVRADLSKDGQVSAVTFARYSGESAIDQAIADTVHRASPFPPLPNSIGTDCVSIGLNFFQAPAQKLLVTTGGGVFRVGGGVSAPKVISAADPQYTKEAQKAKYQGIVVLALIVTPQGDTRDIRVVRKLGMGLDEKAIEAVKKWKFEPAMKDGKPVAVAINVEVTFRLY
jgi:TonB family protein